MILTRKPYAISYHHEAGRGPCVIFCAGFKSSKNGDKALALQSMCKEQGYEYIRFDYGGHGDSGGDFADGSISDWLTDTLDVSNTLPVSKHVLLVGSSMGGWISLLAALQLKEKVCGMLLIACAVDMTAYHSDRLKNVLLQVDELGKPFYQLPNDNHNGNNNDNDYLNDYLNDNRLYKKMLDDGQQHELLAAPIELDIPVHLIHGTQDEVVDWRRSLAVLERLASSDTRLQLIKDGDHRLSNERDLQCIKLSLLNMLQQLVCSHGAL